MAMINCEECGKRMSDTATSCPSCGARHKAVVRISTGRKTGLVIMGFIIAIIGSVMFYTEYTRPFPEYISSYELAQEWSKNNSSLRNYSMVMIIIGLGLLIAGLFSKTKE